MCLCDNVRTSLELLEANYLTQKVIFVNLKRGQMLLAVPETHL